MNILNVKRYILNAGYIKKWYELTDAAERCKVCQVLFGLDDSSLCKNAIQITINENINKTTLSVRSFFSLS